MAGKIVQIPGSLRVTTLIARIVGTLVVAFLALMFVGSTVNPQGGGDEGLPDEWMLTLFFPVGLCADRLVVGVGLICIACLVILLKSQGKQTYWGSWLFSVLPL